MTGIQKNFRLRFRNLYWNGGLNWRTRIWRTRIWRTRIWRTRIWLLFL